MAADGSAAKPDRLEAVDLLRGLVMVIMALDHVRDFFSNRIYLDPTNLKTTTAAIFLTRWITHYCAPTFIFLAGTGAFMSGVRGKSKPELSWFLFTRGLWLAFFEVVINRFLWMFDFDFLQHGAGVFWAIGLSMVALSYLIYLPTRVVAVFGILMILFHNMLDGVTAAQLHMPEWLWGILHRGGDGTFWKVVTSPGDYTLWGCLFGPERSGAPELRNVTFGTGYFVIPWVGVMAAGYGFGSLLQLDRPTRRKVLFQLGLTLTLAFVVVRLANVYGDPKPWAVTSSPIPINSFEDVKNLKEAELEPRPTSNLFTFLSFLNCTKYPPSLCYLLMTLGPAIMCLAAFDRPLGPAARPLITFGRVPLFYYLLHIPLIHGTAVLLDIARFGKSPLLYNGPWAVSDDAIQAGTIRPNYGVDLWVVYLIWIAVVLILYPACYWWAGVKQRHRHWLLSYL